MPANYLVLTGMITLFVTCLIIANLVGSILFSFTVGGQSVLLSAGIIFFPVTFLLTDLLNEFYGARTARFVTLLGLLASLLVFGFMSITEHLPVDGRSLISQPEFLKFSGLYTNMVLASLTAYLIGQLLDIQVFGWFYQWTQNKHLWLRAQGSTIISQGFDSFIVVWLAFSGQLPTETLLQIGLSNYTWKILLVTAITPLLYLGHALLTKALRRQTV